MRSSRVGISSFETRSERPVPRLSNRMSRENEARRSRKRPIADSSHIMSMFETQPGT
jgi:hypothetical protein